MGVGLICCAMLTASAAAGPADGNQGATEMLNLGLRGVYFVSNEGQWPDTEVRYGLRSRGLDVAFRESSFTMHLRREIGQSIEPPVELQPEATESSIEFETLTLGVSFPGSSIVVPEGTSPQVARFNYFVGGKGRGVARDVPSFGEIVYQSLYDGVDLHVIGSDDGVLKYEFHVQPGADYGQIRIGYDGIESICIDDAGDLQIETAFGTLTDRAPIVWQEIGGERSEVAARFEVCDQSTYRIVVDGEVDPLCALVIDPDVEWMQYVGGSAQDNGEDIVIDDDGNTFVAGSTVSVDFEGRTNSPNGLGDAFILKINPSGQLEWMTYYGGTNYEGILGITLDAQGSLLTAGLTFSADFVGRTNSYHGGPQDGFVAKVDQNGQLLWMTYVGGSDSDSGSDVAALLDGDVLLAGGTLSADYEGSTNSPRGSEDCALIRVSATGAIRWMVYIGGTGQDEPRGIALDSVGNVLVTGITESTDFEGRLNTYHGQEDGFVLNTSEGGQLGWMLYLGGNGDDRGDGVAIDSDGNAFVSGWTKSSDFEGRGNAFHGGDRDAFITKVALGGSLAWMKYLGGSGGEYGYGLALDGGGNAVVTGQTYSEDFEGRVNSYYGGVSWDAFVQKVGGDGSIQWMQYLGGTGHDYGNSVAVDGTGRTLVTGWTKSTDFDGRQNSYHGGELDGFVVQLRFPLHLDVISTCPTGGPIRVSWNGATPGGTIALLYARNTGSFAIPNGRPCAGTVLGLGANQLQIVFQGSAGPEGSRTLNSNTGPAACGGYLQLLDLNTCSTSNAARIE